MSAAHRVSVIVRIVVIALAGAAWAAASAGQAGPAGRRPITFPFEFYRNAIWFEAKIGNSRPLRVQFDTAAGSLVLNRPVAVELGLHVLREFDQPNAGSGDLPTRITVFSGATIAYAGGSIELPQVAAIALDEIERTYGTRIDAIVGYPLTARDVVTVDFEGRTITMEDAASFAYTGPGTVLALEGGPEVREPIVRGCVVMPGVDPIEGRFLLDEPHPHCLLFATPFATAHRLPASAEALTGSLLAGSATGVGGKTPYRVGRIGALQLGGITVARPTAAFADSKGGAFARADIAAIIGGEILRRFRVIFDVPHRRVILEKGRSFDEPIEWDASGIKLRTASGDFHQFEVVEIVEPGPGAEAGVRAGDRIAAIDGRPAAQWTLWDIECVFKQAGRVFALTIERDGTRRAVSLRTRRLIEP